jgi:hypothetical protein
MAAPRPAPELGEFPPSSSSSPFTSLSQPTPRYHVPQRVFGKQRLLRLWR